jgi:hypothetical protein
MNIPVITRNTAIQERNRSCIIRVSDKIITIGPDAGSQSGRRSGVRGPEPQEAPKRQHDHGLIGWQRASIAKVALGNGTPSDRKEVCLVLDRPGYKARQPA